MDQETEFERINRVVYEYFQEQQPQGEEDRRNVVEASYYRNPPYNYSGFVTTTASSIVGLKQQDFSSPYSSSSTTDVALVSEEFHSESKGGTTVSPTMHRGVKMEARDDDGRSETEEQQNVSLVVGGNDTSFIRNLPSNFRMQIGKGRSQYLANLKIVTDFARWKTFFPTRQPHLPFASFAYFLECASKEEDYICNNGTINNAKGWIHVCIRGRKI